MRILADENIPRAAVDLLRRAGHDVAWVSEEAPGSDDSDVLRKATEQDRVLVTFDKDFGDLAYVVGFPVTCGIVLFRLSNVPKTSLAEFMTTSLSSHVEWKGFFSVVTEDRVRMRPLNRSP